MNRTTYLKRCTNITLRRRVGCVVVCGIPGRSALLGLAALPGPGVAELIVLPVLGAAAAVLATAVNFFLWHSADPEAQPGYGYRTAAAS
ncbi:hypothetical protein DESA109040_07860 [Deinococcus saxicola]|uniref:hypothetical protein n=1 Tax=Deinococcus saxicola TaxID=249406 RepID=UPI0039F0DB5D